MDRRREPWSFRRLLGMGGWTSRGARAYARKR